MLRTLFCSVMVCLTFVGISSSRSLQAMTASDFALRLSATVQNSPSRISLSWPAVAVASLSVDRKARDSQVWTNLVSNLASTTTSYVDSTATVGAVYEYRVWGKWTGGGMTPEPFVYGYVCTGIEVPLVESRGRILVVVDNTFVSDLAAPLARLEQDLVGDGWTPVRLNVDRTATPASVKAQIVGQYNASPANTKAVLLFGHVPVPYSGSIAPDNHGDHVGAWPADVYYGEMNGNWTDTLEHANSLGRPARQQNRIGDGKFDQSSLPSDVELMVGRVDLSNLPAFAPLTERDLLARYLDKDHNQRHRVFTLTRQALNADNFGTNPSLQIEGIGMLQSQAALFGAANSIKVIDANNSHVWKMFQMLNTGNTIYSFAQEVAYGGWDRTGGVYTANVATYDLRCAFMSMVGSYFGDWDVSNNMLRAPLATPSYTLSNAWSGRPNWFFHHMGMGEPIGSSARVSQNNTSLYSAMYLNGAYTRQIHMALMGDPTLRLHIVAPPTGFSGTSTGVLNWTAPAGETVLGYNVYRSANATGPFTKLNGGLISGTTYTDAAAPGSYTYMVKAVKLETGSGTYYNASQGIFANVTIVPMNSAPTLSAIGVLNGASEDTAFAITHAGLAAVANEADADGNAVSFRLETSIAGTLTKNGAPVTPGSLLSAGETWVWTPPANAFGTLPVGFIKAWDGQAASATAVQMSVSVAPVNDAPTLSSVNALTGMSEDTPFYITYAMLAGNANEADIEDDVISFRAYGWLGSLTKIGAPGSQITQLAPGETWILTPAVNTNGVQQILTLRAWDGQALSALLVAVLANIAAVNDAPLVTSAPRATPNSATVGQSVLFTVGVNDPDGPALTITWNFGDGTTGNGGSTTHTYAAAGAYLVSCTISDGIASATYYLMVTVNAAP